MDRSMTSASFLAGIKTDTLGPVVGTDLKGLRRDVIKFTKVIMVTAVETPNNNVKAT